MSDIPLSCSQFADNNPDITGVGVRASFYLQTFLLVLLVDRSWEDAPVALWTFIATNAGLTLAAIGQRDALTLFQALQVSNLVWLANFGTFLAMASYSRQKAASREIAHPPRTFGVKFGAMIQSLLSMALTIYMWARAKSFGSLSNCSYLVKYIFFVVETRAVGVGRILGLTITTILSTAYVVIAVQELRAYYRDERQKSILPSVVPAPEPLFPDTPSTSVPPILHLSSSSTLRNSEGYRSAEHRHRQLTLLGSSAAQSPHIPKPMGKQRPRRRRWSSNLDPMLVGIIICQAMVFTYLIVSTELLIRRNPSNDHSIAQWSFGQILALIVVLPSALSLLGAIRERGVKRLSKHKSKRNRRTRRRQSRDELNDINTVV